MARKRKGIRIDAYISEHDHLMMQSFMVRNNYSISDVMREALNEFLQNHDKEFYDIYVNKQQLKAGYYIKL